MLVLWNGKLCQQSLGEFYKVVSQTNVFSQEMGVRLSFSKWYWTLTLKIIAPILIICIVSLTLINHTPCYYGDYIYPSNIQVSNISNDQQTYQD